MPKSVAIILVNYHDYGQRFLIEFLDGLRQQDYSGLNKIFIVDNESTDETFIFLKNIAPEAEIIRNKNNDGFAKGNNDGIRVALAQGFDLIALFNLDTVLEPDCLRLMIKSLESDEKIGAVQPRLMLYQEKSKINSLGNVTHFLGFGYCANYGEDLAEVNSSYYENKRICYPSGAAVVFRRNVLEKIGLFDREFWMYNEDQDLGWRIWLSGYECRLSFDAVCYHKYEFSRSISKYYWMDRNRILSIFKNYDLLTLILIFPAFIIMELGLMLTAWQGGWIEEKLSVYRYFSQGKTWRYLLSARRAAQSLRQVKDREIIWLFSGTIWYQEIADWKLRFINPFFGAYWKIVRSLIRR